MLRRLLGLAALVVLSGCSSLPTSPGTTYGTNWRIEPVPGYVLIPPAEFEEWFDELAECAGPARRPYMSIRWRVVERIYWRNTTDDPWMTAYGFYSNNTIYLLQEYIIAWEYAVLRYVARHEMLHHITQMAHPEIDEWMDRCV